MQTAGRMLGAIIVCSSISAAAPGQQPPAASPPPVIPDQAALDKQFQETMSGSVLEGAFTVTGREDRTPRTEKYTIANVKKLQNDYWLFEARIQYGDNDVTVPLPLQVKWAGDTPVITLTDMMIPGLGTYTARVLIYRGHYAGMWSGADHGGQLFGRVVKASAEEKNDPGQP